jgi:hypothetical protein
MTMSRIAAGLGSALLLATVLAGPVSAAPSRPSIDVAGVCVMGDGTLAVTVQWADQAVSGMVAYTIEVTLTGPQHTQRFGMVSGDTFSSGGFADVLFAPNGVAADFWGKASARALSGLEGRSHAFRQPSAGWPSCEPSQ